MAEREKRIMFQESELKNQYEKLMSVINGCICPVSYEELAAREHILVIAMNEEGTNRRFLERIEAFGTDVKITLIAQPKMLPILSPYTGSRVNILEWKGAYTVAVVDKVCREVESRTDAFVFFGGQKMNLRNLNLLEIACGFPEALKVFCIDSDDELYRYDKTDLLLQAVRMYLDADKFIGLNLKYES